MRHADDGDHPTGSRSALLAALSAALLTAAPARAHFALQAPASWMSQDAVGSPQLQGPCGDEAGGAPTGLVTAVAVGDTIDVTVDERIFHPGHYRITLAVNDRAELPAPPPVTPGSTPCGSAPVQSPAVFPVLADGVLEHAQPYTGPQTVRVTLPPGVTCEHCTLQVIQFMSNHGLNVPGGCFYHHCADLAIRSASAAPDGGSAPPGGGSAGAPAGSVGGASSRGGCSATSAPVAWPGRAGLLALAALAARRWRRPDPPSPGARRGPGPVP